MTITPSHIIQYLYCPRFVFFEYVLQIPQYEERHFRVQQGRNIHDIKQIRNKEYLRQKLGVIKKQVDVYLTSNHLRGKVDEVLWLSDGTMSPLDYKFAKYKDRIYDTYKQQVFCYAVLIEKNYNLSVNNGYLIYTRSKNKIIKLEINKNDKEIIYKSTENIIEIIEKNCFPKATKYKKRCVSCTYRNICVK
ncbi:MAG: CRISPR-associated protein Cas4 [Bacteroidales bacterium]|nr:CRISPR-associated protein Cas4 [Bacteroidales bacterium]